MNKSTYIKVAVFACCLILAIGCSDKKATESTPVTHPLQVVDVTSIVESVMPPAYDGPTAVSGGVDSIWLYGNYPLLGKVFGSDDPQALYANIGKFKMYMHICQSFVRVDDDGNPIPGEISDSVYVDGPGGDSMWAHATGVVTRLNAPVTIPTAVQEIMGTSIDMDYLISLEVAEIPGASIYIALKLTDSTQSFMQFFRSTEEKSETQLAYVSLRLEDSTFDFRGCGRVAHPPEGQETDSEHFCWGYNITSNANSDFAYRMAYTSDGIPGSATMYKFLGGGNRNTEFALRFRQYHPADTTVCDSMFMYDQVFGPDYTEGAGLLSSYDSYLNETLFYPYEAIPQSPLANPFE